ncbi:hypothetical protein ABZ946_01400 [Streptomyces sp. NPDC046324]|uniref:hypothetical protein n=1 Tax=Streptomyces sp. NPDC046324 TaxID=3154915 RepID=UPI0033E0D6EE
MLNHWFQLALITPVMLYTGWPVHLTGWLALRHRSADMNSLITLGTSAAYGFSLLVTLAPGLLPEDVREVYFEAVGVILTLILLGRLLEARAKAGTGEAIRALIGLQARTAHVLRDGTETEIPVEAVVVGDEIVIRPGDARTEARRPSTPCAAWKSTPRPHPNTETAPQARCTSAPPTAPPPTTPLPTATRLPWGIGNRRTPSEPTAHIKGTTATGAGLWWMTA